MLKSPFENVPDSSFPLYLEQAPSAHAAIFFRIESSAMSWIGFNAAGSSFGNSNNSGAKKIGIDVA